ncbi:MAG: hypothetical protein AAF570_23070, partial [Bacteroidota bacterium]
MERKWDHAHLIRHGKRPILFLHEKKKGNIRLIEIMDTGAQNVVLYNGDWSNRWNRFTSWVEKAPGLRATSLFFSYARGKDKDGKRQGQWDVDELDPDPRKGFTPVDS